MFQHIGQEGQRFAQGPRDKTAADTLIAGCLELLVEPSRISIATANQPQATGLGDGCRERAAARESHRRREDGMADIERAGEAG